MIDQYAVFAGTEFYAGGGASNLIGWAGSLEEAWLLVDQNKYMDWCHALDVTTGQVHGRPGWWAKGHGDTSNNLLDWKVKH